MFGQNLDIVFFVLALLFAVLAWRERTRADGVISVRGRTWGRIAVIFFCVSAFLAWVLRFSGA